jgi:hypothetical protein
MARNSDFSFPFLRAGFESFSELIAESPHFDLDDVINDALRYLLILRTKTGDDSPENLRFTVANNEGDFHFIDDQPGENHTMVSPVTFIGDSDQLKQAAKKLGIATPEEMFTRAFILYEKILIGRMDGYHPALLDKKGGLDRIVLPGEPGPGHPPPASPAPTLQ